MKSITLDCNAKINLALDVTGKREDGYHELELIFLEIPLCDTITVSLRNDGEVRLACDDISLPTDDRNIAYRAAERILNHTKSKYGADINLVKRIPHGAGLGGGSSDAAGVLKAVNLLLGEPCDEATLMEIGKSLGADVPFFIMGGCALGEGIGEVLTPLPVPDGFAYLIAKPTQSVSTAYVYQNLKLDKRPPNLCVQAVAEGIRRGDTKMICENTGNILESVTEEEFPVIRDIKACMKRCGAAVSLMSGSGTSVFGMFERKSDAQTAADELLQYTKDVYLV